MFFQLFCHQNRVHLRSELRFTETEYLSLCEWRHQTVEIVVYLYLSLVHRSILWCDRQLFSIARIVGNGENGKKWRWLPVVWGMTRIDGSFDLFFLVAAIICVFVGYQWRYADYRPTISSVRHLCCNRISDAKDTVLISKCSLPIRLSFCVNYVSFLIHTDCQRIKLDEKIAKWSPLIIQTTKEESIMRTNRRGRRDWKFERHLFRSTFKTVCTFNFDENVYTFF